MEELCRRLRGPRAGGDLPEGHGERRGWRRRRGDGTEKAGRRAPAGIRGARPAGGCQKERGQPRGRRPGSQPRSAALVPAPNFLQPRGGTRRGVTGALRYGPRPARSAARPLTAAPRAGPPDTKAQPRPAAPALSARPRPRGRTWAAPPKFVHPGPSAAWAAPTNRWRGPEPPPAGRRGGGAAGETRGSGCRGRPPCLALPCPRGGSTRRRCPRGRRRASGGGRAGARPGGTHPRGAPRRAPPPPRPRAGLTPHRAPTAATWRRRRRAGPEAGPGRGSTASARSAPGAAVTAAAAPTPPRAARPENGAGRERGVRGESRGFPKPERAGAGRRGGRA